MIILLSLFILTVLFCILAYKTESDSFSIISFVLFLLFMVFLISLPVYLMVGYEDIEEYKATQQTVTNFRKSGNNIESASLNIKVIECNQWLASAKYYRKSIFRIYNPKEIDTLKYIE